MSYKFYHPDRVEKPTDKWVLGAYQLERLAYIPRVRTSKDIYDTKSQVTKIIDKIMLESGDHERGWFVELPVDAQIIEFYDDNGEIKI